MMSLKSHLKSFHKKKNKLILSPFHRIKYLRSQKKKKIMSLEISQPLSRCSCFRYRCNNCKTCNNWIISKSMYLALSICMASVQMATKIACFITPSLTLNSLRLHLQESLLVSKILSNGALSLKSPHCLSTEKMNACQKNI
jgi:hypothetical protein